MSAAIKQKIESATRAGLRETRRRSHLGASAIGKRCARQVWYGFRWAYDTDHTGRIRRLFSRGHEEEARFSRWLRMAGLEVRDYSERLMYHAGSDSYTTLDWDAEEWSPELDDVSNDALHIVRATAREQGPKQWSFVDHDGHFAGSSDGKVRGDGLPPGWGGLEYKTHSEKSFTELEKKGVLTSKPVHWVQMQIYMHYFKLPWTLYVAVNKNTDELYFEVVYYRQEVALQYVDMARNIIFAKQAPAKLTQDPSWFECKFCDFREICHKGEAPLNNCRSCVYASPGPAGSWECGKHRQTIPAEFIPKGCSEWVGIQ